MKKVLLLGSSGFLGGHIQSELIKKKLLLETPSRKSLNLYSKTSTSNFIKSRKIKYDYIINCAAFSGGQSLMQSKPMDMFLNNTKLLQNFIHLCNNLLPKKIISIGSACSYPDLKKILTEDDLWRGRINPMVEGYGLIKKNEIAALDILKKLTDINYNHYILTNLYGPHDDFKLETSHVLSALINKAHKSKKDNSNIEIWGTGKPVRDFLFVKDAAKIIVQTMSKDLGVINIGTGKGISIKQLSIKINKIFKLENKIYFNKNYNDGVKKKVVSNKKIKRYIDFKFMTLDEGLKKTIDWYLKNN